jgi:glycosyltransferase involved in cell wall biosynthesis
MPEICIIIPFYNEEKRFDVESFNEFVKTHTDISFCLVNDGSSDRTIQILNELQQRFSNVEALDLKINRGKAEAIRSGVKHLLTKKSYSHIAFLDADFSAPLETIPYMLDYASDKSVVLGSRILYLGSNISRNPFRHYVGRVFATMASEILNLPIYDTQCGAKIFAVKMAEVGFKDTFVTTWLFDLELIMRIINEFGWDYFMKNSREVPLPVWIEKGGSKVKLSYAFKMPFDLLKIRRKYGKVKK